MANYDQEIYNVAIQEGFTPTVAKIIVAQARLESSNYGSNVFKCNNNMYGMKYIGQPLASRGTLAPSNEISSGCTASGTGCDRKGIGNCQNSDYYAKYQSPADSAKDVINRLYKITRNGVGFNELNAATDTLTYATLLKKRGYYGFGAYGTAQADSEIRNYSLGLKARLLLVQITDYIKKNEAVIKKTTSYAAIGLILLGAGFFVYKKYLKK